MGEDTLSNGYEIYTVWLLRCRVEVLHITFVHKSMLCTPMNTTETHTRVVGRCIQWNTGDTRNCRQRIKIMK